MHRGKWNKYAKDWHVARGRKMSEKARRETSARMKAKNPMKSSDVAARVSAKMKGRQLRLSDETKKKIAEGARKRMLSDRNPMKNPDTVRRVLSQVLSHKTSAFEKNFRDWSQAQNLPLVHTGTGVMWIARRNPDFRVLDQKKAVELTQQMVFIPNKTKEEMTRTIENYGVPTICHYQKRKWQCLVVFLRRSQTMTAQLRAVIENYSLPESVWSGVWSYDRLIPFAK